MTEQSAPTVAPAAGRPGEGWRRLHPLTPLLRGYRVLAVLAAALAQETVRSPGARTATGLALLAAIPFVLAYGLLAWRFTRYQIAEGDLRVETGVLMRRSRRVPLARLQAVDVVRPLLARALGLAELRLEVVGHGKTEAPLAYLTESEAQLLRGRLLALAAGVTEDAAEAPEAVLVQVPTGALATSIALGAPAIIGSLLVVAAIVAAWLAPRALLGVAVSAFPVLLGTGGVAVHRFLDEFGFTVADSPDGLRLRHGLLETRAQTIPRGRVQAVRIVEPVLWRRWNRVRVEVDVAGYASRGRGSRDQRMETSAMLPVAPRSVATVVLARVLDGVDLDRLRTVRPPRRARWRAPLMWHYLGVGWDDRHAVTSYGRLRRVIDVVPNGKIQSLRLVQGPLARRLRIATLHLDTAGLDVRAAAAYRDEAEARALLEAGILRARAARQAASLRAPTPG